jgi:pimeloyl-ACP methyl ester carboxylesterase
MPRRHINGVELYYELRGEGEPLVLVHGSWTDHTSWRFVVDALAETYRVLTYDRRGHSRSERSDSADTRQTDEDDLAALIEALDLAPAHLVGNSFGAAIALGLAARRPDLARSVVAHEPPVHGISQPGSELESLIRPVLATMDEVVDDLRHGHAERGAARFVEQIAFGPGVWPTLPAETRQTMIANAATLLDEAADPDWGTPPPPPPASVPVLLTDGETSPAWFGAIVGELTATTHQLAARHTFTGAGHVPHLTHPDDLVAVVRAFAAASGTRVAPFSARSFPLCGTGATENH